MESKNNEFLSFERMCINMLFAQYLVENDMIGSITDIDKIKNEL